MERLTRRNRETGRAELADFGDMGDWDAGLPYDVILSLGQALDRLMAYEETGLLPKDVGDWRRDRFGR